MRCNSVYYSANNKKITSNHYPFLQLSSFLVIICLVILNFLYFRFICIFLNFHSLYLSCSPRIVIYVIFSRDLIFDSWNVFQKKNFYQKSGKIFFFWNTFKIEDSKISSTFRSCMPVLNVERKVSKKNLTTCERKISLDKPALTHCSADNFLSPIPISDWLILCWGNLILHQ